MNEQLYRISSRIRSELLEIDRILMKIKTGWEKAKKSGDDLYVDSVALNLHGFYSGFERIFQLIATEIDGEMPNGENWHKLLLDKMTQEIPALRPAIFSKELLSRLDEFRGFRHVVRNVYTFIFNMDKMEKLVDEAPNLYKMLQKELLAFADFIDKID